MIADYRSSHNMKQPAGRTESNLINSIQNQILKKAILAKPGTFFSKVCTIITSLARPATPKSPHWRPPIRSMPLALHLAVHQATGPEAQLTYSSKHYMYSNGWKQDFIRKKYSGYIRLAPGIFLEYSREKSLPIEFLRFTAFVIWTRFSEVQSHCHLRENAKNREPCYRVRVLGVNTGTSIALVRIHSFHCSGDMVKQFCDR